MMPIRKLHSLKRNFLNAFREFFNAEHAQAETRELRAVIKPIALYGFVVIGIIILFFGVWGTLAPIDSAAIAPGSVVLHANRKTVQHLEGGIIAKILVEEGDSVTQGQSLLELNATSANAQQELLLGQLRTAKATQARLLAEREEAEAITFDPRLFAQTEDPVIASLIDSQNRLFHTRQATLRGKTDVLEQQVLQYQDQIIGLKAQKRGARNQLVLLKDEITSVQHLLNQGFERKPRLLELQRRAAELEGKEGEYVSDIAVAKSNIARSQLEILNIQNEDLKEVMTELKEVQQTVDDLEEKLRASGDVLERTVIRAPQAGKITGLKFHTTGGVITPGQAIMDIIPQDDTLIIEAHVQPQDIDVVHEGLSAKVMLSAYRSRYVPRLEGKVTYVSADTFTNEKTGQSYYLARIAIQDGALAKLTAHVELYPGMPAETFITVGKSTLLDYLLSPLISSFHRAFKEQ